MQADTNWASAEPVDLGDLMREMQAIWSEARKNCPLQETWLSTRACPPDGHLRVTTADAGFVVAHPSFWRLVEARTEREYLRAPRLTERAFLPYAGIQIIEADPHPSDSPEAAQMRRGHWRRLREAIVAAGGEVPSWVAKATAPTGDA